MTVGANIRKAREALGLSQAQVAKHVGLGFQQQTIVKIEKGDRPLRLSEAVRVAKVLGVEVPDLYAPGGGLFQLLGVFRSVRELYDNAMHAVFQLEEWRLTMVNMAKQIQRDGHTLDQGLRDGIEQFSREDLVELAVAEGRGRSAKLVSHAQGAGRGGKR